jgi:hypothetical protein
MGDLCRLVWYVVIGLFRSQAELQAEILVLRISSTCCGASLRTDRFKNFDRLVFVGLYSLASSWMA